MESNRVQTARVLSWKWRLRNEHRRKGRRAAAMMGGRANNRDEADASWEDAQAAGGSEVEQRDGLTLHGFQGTYSV